ncbi:MAG: radical SAM protein [Abditibacteriota bacterium]|nr:radical SAM protein [Abditibacteriota bacterium]
MRDPRLAAEINRAERNPAAERSVLLCFPNVYSLGIASLGYQMVYEMFNACPNTYCDRCFLPDDVAEYNRTEKPLLSLETGKTFSSFDAVAFSVSFEPDYPNILTILRLGGVPICRRDRTDEHPIVIIGGIAVTFNPEPLTAFADAFVIGDGEEVLPKIAEILGRDIPKTEKLEALSALDGLYVPEFYEPGKKIKRLVCRNLDDYPASSCVLTEEGEFGETTLIEVGRGCMRGCRFCVAGYATRPARFRKVETDARRCGLVSAAVFDHPKAAEICRNITDRGGEFTLSSVRAETVTAEMAALMKKAGLRTLTIAPEAGSQRLRNVINKCLTEEDIFAAARNAAEAGLTTVKLYYMIGLPTETDGDVAAIADLTNRLAKEFKTLTIRASVGCFVPKPFTPFQRCAMEGEKSLKKKIAYLRKETAKGGVKFSFESPKAAHVQAVLARGDGDLASFLEEWSETGNGTKALRKIDDDKYTRQRDAGEAFPWEKIDMLVSRDYLEREYEKALREETTTPCVFGKCNACGACGREK